MKTYLHTQPAGRWLVIPALVAIVLTGVAVGTRAWAVLAGVAVLGVVSWIFRSLTVEVADGVFRWRFGSGWPSGTVPLGDIASAEAVRTAWWAGWGIHVTRWGWLYNIAGFEAVAIRTKSGRRLAVGTDDPAGLVRALVGVQR